jgi:hypothetical protein
MSALIALGLVSMPDPLDLGLVACLNPTRFNNFWNKKIEKTISSFII